jgi:hypothetical protein
MTEPYPPYHFYLCYECDPEGEKNMSHNEMVAHLREVHRMKEPIKAKKELLMHINREPRHSATYKVKIENGPTIHEYYG